MHEAASGIASPPLKRHELLWISPEAWAEALSHQPGLPDGIGINWRELWRSLDVAESRVLAKSFDRVRLIAVRSIVKPALAP